MKQNLLLMKLFPHNLWHSFLCPVKHVIHGYKWTYTWALCLYMFSIWHLWAHEALCNDLWSWSYCVLCIPKSRSVQSVVKSPCFFNNHWVCVFNSVNELKERAKPRCLFTLCATPSSHAVCLHTENQTGVKGGVKGERPLFYETSSISPMHHHWKQRRQRAWDGGPVKDGKGLHWPDCFLVSPGDGGSDLWWMTAQNT